MIYFYLEGNPKYSQEKGYIFDYNMVNFKKAHSLKLILLILAVTFCFSNTVYGVDIPHKTHLRPYLQASQKGSRLKKCLLMIKEKLRKARIKISPNISLSEEFLQYTMPITISLLISTGSFGQNISQDTTSVEEYPMLKTTSEMRFSETSKRNIFQIQVRGDALEIKQKILNFILKRNYYKDCMHHIYDGYAELLPSRDSNSLLTFDVLNELHNKYGEKPSAELWNQLDVLILSSQFRRGDISIEDLNNMKLYLNDFVADIKEEIDITEGELRRIVNAINKIQIAADFARELNNKGLKADAVDIVMLFHTYDELISESELLHSFNSEEAKHNAVETVIRFKNEFSTYRDELYAQLGLKPELLRRDSLPVFSFQHHPELAGGQYKEKTNEILIEILQTMFADKDNNKHEYEAFRHVLIHELIHYFLGKDEGFTELIAIERSGFYGSPAYRKEVIVAIGQAIILGYENGRDIETCFKEGLKELAKIYRDTGGWGNTVPIGRGSSRRKHESFVNKMMDKYSAFGFERDEISEIRSAIEKGKAQIHFSYLKKGLIRKGFSEDEIQDFSKAKGCDLKKIYVWVDPTELSTYSIGMTTFPVQYLGEGYSEESGKFTAYRIVEDVRLYNEDIEGGTILLIRSREEAKEVVKEIVGFVTLKKTEDGMSVIIRDLAGQKIDDSIATKTIGRILKIKIKMKEGDVFQPDLKLNLNNHRGTRGSI